MPEPVVGTEETQPTMVQRAGVHEEVVNIIISLIIIVIIIVVNIIIVVTIIININIVMIVNMPMENI